MKRVLLALMLATSAASADPAVPPAVQAKADALFVEAQAHFKANEFKEAIEQFQAAYELVHDPVYLYNLAQSYRKVLDCVAAADYYQKYLDAAKDAPNRAKVEGWIRELAPCVDERRSADAAKAELEKQKAEAAHKVVTAPPPVVTTKRTVDPGAKLRLAGEATGAVGVVGLVVGIGFAMHGRAIENDLRSACQTECTADDVKAKQAAGDRANAIATVGLIGGGLATLAGAGLYFYGRSRPTRVEVVPQPNGAVVSAHFSF